LEKFKFLRVNDQESVKIDPLFLVILYAPELLYGYYESTAKRYLPRSEGVCSSLASSFFSNLKYNLRKTTAGPYTQTGPAV